MSCLPSPGSHMSTRHPWSAYARSDGVARRRRSALQTTAAGAVAGVSLRGGDAVALCRGRTGEGEERWVEGAGLGACAGIIMRMGSGMADKVCCFFNVISTLAEPRLFASVRDCYIVPDGTVRPSPQQWQLSRFADHHAPAARVT